MILKDFIEQFIAPNTLISLWIPYRDANGSYHKELTSNYQIYTTYDHMPVPGVDPISLVPFSQPKPMQESSMSWEVTSAENVNTGDFSYVYAHCEVMYITDIVRETELGAINIVIEGTPEVVAMNEILNRSVVENKANPNITILDKPPILPYYLNGEEEHPNSKSTKEEN